MSQPSTDGALEGLVEMARPRRTPAVVAALALSVLLVGWLFLGTIEVRVEGRGLFVRRMGIARLRAWGEGEILEWSVEPGAVVGRGQELGRWRHEDLDLALRSPANGRVLERLAARGERVVLSQELIRIDPLDEELLGLLFVSEEAAGAIRPGMLVRMAPEAFRDSSAGFLLGKVRSTTWAALSPESVEREVEGHPIREEILARGWTVSVQIELEQTEKGDFVWSSGFSEPSPLGVGMSFGAEIVIDRIPPARSIFR